MNPGRELLLRVILEKAKVSNKHDERAATKEAIVHREMGRRAVA